MDKKNTFIGLVFIALVSASCFGRAYNSKSSASRSSSRQKRYKPLGQSTTPADAALVAANLQILALGIRSFQQVEAVEVEAASKPLPPESTVALYNDYIEAVFTTRGGAIQTVSFLQTKSGERDDYIYNKGGLLPALSLSLNSVDGEIREFDLDYRIEQQSSNSVTFVLYSGEGLSIRRHYRIASTGAADEPYTIEHSTTFKNNSSSRRFLLFI